MTRRTGLSALMSVGTTVALMGIAMAQSASPSASGAPSSGSGSSGYSDSRSMGSSGSMGGSGSMSGGGASTAGAIDSTTTTTSQTTEYGTDAGYGAPTATVDEPLDNTGGEPLVITLLGSLVAGSALLMRRKLGTN